MSKSTSLFLLSLLLWASLPLTVNAQEVFTPSFEPQTCPMPVPAGYVDGGNFICGTVEVPELHSDPQGKTIRLSVTILKSEGGAADPLVMFNGGPGSDILGLLPIMASPMAAPVTQTRDVVLMSERGTLGADPFLACPELAAAAEGQFGIPLADFTALQLEAYGACRERLVAEGVNLNAYNNPERAADVPLVMQALGYSEFNLWGVSGGGILAQYVLREHPEGVRTVMTDSGAFPTAYVGTVFYNIYEVVSGAYRRLFETCAADAVCAETYPDLENVFWGMVEELNTNPAPVQITNPATGELVDWALTGDVLISILGNEFANVEVLPKVIFALAAGDYSYVVERVPNLYVVGGDYADALYESVVCSEISGLTQDTAATANAYPQVVQALTAQVQFHLDICAFWGMNPIAEGAVISSDVPILIMEGKFDSNKEPSLGTEVAQNFSTSYVAEFADTAHGVIGACTLSMMGEFMNDPSTAPDMTCVPTETTFITTETELTFSEQTLAVGVTALIPDGWSEVDTGVYVNPLDNSVLLITALPVADIDEAITMFATAVGLSAPTKLGDVPLGEQTWAVYQVIEGDTGSMIAATVHNEQVYLMGLQTSAATIESATETILRPVVESIVFVE